MYRKIYPFQVRQVADLKLEILVDPDKGRRSMNKERPSSDLQELLVNNWD